MNDIKKVIVLISFKKRMKLAIITGGTKGIGKAIALKFAKEKFKLAICSRSKEDLELLEKDLLGYILKEDFLLLDANISSKYDVEKFADAVLNFAQPEVLINNAGLFKQDLILDSEHYLEQHLQTNLFGAFNLTKKVVPKMIEQGSGHIFNICSIASKKIFDQCSTYSISKYAVYGFGQALREELKPHNIKVTNVLPGATMSNSWAGVEIDANRIMKASDIAEMIFASYQLSKNSVVEEIVMRPQLGDL